MERFVKGKASVLVCHASFLFVPLRSKHFPGKNVKIVPVTLEVSTASQHFTRYKMSAFLVAYKTAAAAQHD